jgi:hypothetical protein
MTHSISTMANDGYATAREIKYLLLFSQVTLTAETVSTRYES